MILSVKRFPPPPPVYFGVYLPSDFVVYLPSASSPTDCPQFPCQSVGLLGTLPPPPPPSMDHEDYLSLPPWEKFRKYGHFPWKLLLHSSLLILVTTQSILSNREFAAYSQSIWNSIPHLFFPPDASSSQTTTSLSKYEYYLFTQNQTISDANLLVSSYFSYSDVSLGEISIYNSADSSSANSLPAPRVVVVTSSGEERSYTIKNSSDTSWPLSLSSPQIKDAGYLRTFFDKLVTMTFFFSIKSSGISDDSAWSTSKHLCFVWELTFTYDLRAMGEILVSYYPVITSRCEKLRQDTYIYIASVFVLVLGIIYQILMLRAFSKQLVILHGITRLKEEVVGDGTGNEIDEDKSKLSLFFDVWSSSGVRELAFMRKSSNTNKKNALVGEVKEAEYDGGGDCDEEEDDDDEKEEDGVTALEPNTKTALLIPSTTFSSSSPISACPQPPPHSSNLTTSMSNAIGEEMAVLKEALKALSWKDILSVLNVWVISSSIGNIFTLIYSSSVVYSLDDISTENYERVFLGISAFFLWFTVLQYVEYYPRYYVLIQMLKTTTPQIAQFLFGVLPLFFGYSLLGMIIFSESIDRFGNLQLTMRTLFSLVNGDIIYDTFLSVASYGVGAQLYIYIYILIFSYVVLMSVIAIVEESYFHAQKKLRERELDAKTPDEPLLSSNASITSPDRPDLSSSNRSTFIDQEASARDRDSSDQTMASRRSMSRDGKRGLRRNIQTILHIQANVKRNTSERNLQDMFASQTQIHSTATTPPILITSQNEDAVFETIRNRILCTKTVEEKETLRIQLSNLLTTLND